MCRGQLTLDTERTIVQELKVVWKKIKKFPRYEVSSCGQVRNYRTGRLKIRSLTKSGYYFVNLYKEDMDKPIPIPVHRLVAFEFVEGDKSLTVNHKNGIKLDNIHYNLEWITASENTAHARRTGLTVAPKGELCGKSILTEKKVLDIRERYRKGTSQVTLGKIFKVTQANISAIVGNKTWKHI